MKPIRFFLVALAVAWPLTALYSVAQSPVPTPTPDFAARVGGPELPGGGRIQCELPGELHRRNTESKGLGLCVFTSLHHLAIYQNVPQLVEFPAWVRSSGIAGGSDPVKTANLVARISRERGMPAPDYIQVEDADLEIIKAACRSGRMTGSTYGLSPTGRYNRAPIAHMINVVHADDTYFVVLDNNYIGASQYEFMSPAEFLVAYRTVPGRNGRPVQNRGGWTFVALSPSPPPVPIN